jgi:DNA (cytosine-5)-methyltransferase 1
MTEEKPIPWFLQPTDCDSCGVLWNEGNTGAFQATRCRNCKRNPTFKSYPGPKDKHDHYETITRPIIEESWCDLYSCGGGAGKGIIDAGFKVTGVDIDPKCRKFYPGKFVQYNVLEIEKLIELDGTRFVDSFDGFWASPPCQHFSPMTIIRGNHENHPDLIAKTREILLRTGKPYIIENVDGAKDQLIDPIMLCGLMFGLPLYHHRYFECSFPVQQPEHPEHAGQQKFSVVGRLVSTVKNGGSARYQAMKAAWQDAMGIYHIPLNITMADGQNMFSQAIPPAFSKYLLTQYKIWKATQ